MRLIKFFLLLALIYTGTYLTFAQTGDGIPDNCEHARTPEQSVNFPRYEFHNQRVALVSWTTGQDVMILDSDLVAEAIYFREWSSDCRFLIATVQINNLSDFVVWDTQTGNRALSIGGERHYPYHYYLNGNRVIVETPQQAWLVNLETGSHVMMEAEWDEYLNRNFRSAYLNDEQGWVEVTLLDNERSAYYQATGAVVEDYYVQIAQNSPDTINDCRAYSSNPSHRVGYYVRYEANQVRLFNSGQLVRVLRDNLITPQIMSPSFSEDCRYYAASIARENEDIYDTVIWDVQSGRELTFADARLIPHQFQFLRDDYAIIQTRNGGFLWNLSSDERLLLTEGVVVESGWSGTTVNNFYQVELVKGQLWTVNVNAPTGVTVYDLNTGNRLAFYDNGGTERAVYQHMNDNWLAVYPQYNYRHRPRITIGLWNTTTGEGHYLLPGTRYQGSGTLFVMSEDERYFLYAYDGSRYRPSFFRLWDLENLNEDGSANSITETQFLQTSRFRSFRDGILTTGERSYDVLTGEMLYVEDSPLVYPANPEIATPASNCERGDRIIVRYNNDVWVMDNSTGERIASLGAWQGRSYHFTEDSCYIIYSRRYGGIGNLAFDARTYEIIDLPLSYGSIVDFAPDGQTVLIHGRINTNQDYGLYIWHISDDHLLPLVADTQIYSLWRAWLHWDYSRGQILVGSQLSVRAFDLQTGEMLAYYEGNGAWDNYLPHYPFSIQLLDNRWLILRGAMISVIYDLDTGDNTAIRTDGRFIISISENGQYASSRVVSGICGI